MTDRDSLISFSGRFDLPRPSTTYRLGLLGVTVAVVALPVLYFALVAAMAWLVWWHLTTNGWLASWGGMTTAIWLYLAPAIAGAIAVVSLIKPVIPRFHRAPSPVILDPAAEPHFFRLLEKVCGLVGSPMPREVRVDCSINASASLGDSLLEWHRPGVVLTLGLPLVAGLSLAQFTGVVAHELGHARQGGGLRLLATVRSVDAWFARIVGGRDHWHKTLREGFAEGGPMGMDLLGALSSGAVSASRGVLKGLMLAGRMVSSYSQRQMEFAADRCQAHVVGAEAAVETLGRLRVLLIGAELVGPEILAGLQAGVAPANLPTFLTERLERATDEERGADDQSPPSPPTRLDSHPTRQARTLALQTSGLTGVVVAGAVPAREVFLDFDRLCQRATREHYTRVGLDVETLNLVDGLQVANATSARESMGGTITRFFGGCWSGYRPLRIEPFEIGGQSDEGGSEETAKATSDAIARQYREYEWLESRRREAFVAGELLQTGYSTLEEFGEKSIEDAEATERWAVESQRQLEGTLALFERAIGGRLSRSGMSDEWLDAFHRVADALPHVRELIRLGLAEDALRSRSPADPPLMGTKRRLDGIEREVTQAYDAIRTGLGSARSPLPSAAGVSLVEWCGLTQEGNRQRLAAAERVLSRYVELLAALAEATLDAEAGRRTSPSGAPPSDATEPADQAAPGT